jgi:hypothetical protein
MGAINRRTDVELLIDACASRGGTWGREEVVVAYMQQRHKWPEARTKGPPLNSARVVGCRCGGDTGRARAVL